MNSLTPASDRSSSGLSFSGASACCALCSSALAAFAITSLQAAPGLPLGHQGRDRHTQLWLSFLPCVLQYLTHEAVNRNRQTTAGWPANVTLEWTSVSERRA